MKSTIQIVQSGIEKLLEPVIGVGLGKVAAVRSFPFTNAEDLRDLLVYYRVDGNSALLSTPATVFDSSSLPLITATHTYQFICGITSRAEFSTHFEQYGYMLDMLLRRVHDETPQAENVGSLGTVQVQTATYVESREPTLISSLYAVLSLRHDNLRIASA